MTPEQLAACLNLVASRIDSSEVPSRTAVASDLRAIVAMMDSDGAHFAGLWSKLRGVLRFKDQGEKDLLAEGSKIKNYINKKIPKLKTLTTNTMKYFVDLLNADKDYIAIFIEAAKNQPAFNINGSDDVKSLLKAFESGDEDNIIGAAGLCDSFWKGKGLRKSKADRKELDRLLDGYLEAVKITGEEVTKELNEHYTDKKIDTEYSIKGIKPKNKPSTPKLRDST